MATRAATRPDPGQFLMYRVLPLLVVITVATAGARYLASARGWISDEAGVLIMALFSICVFGALSVWSARKLRVATTAVRTLEREDIYHRVANAYPTGALLVFDHDLRFVVAEGSNLAEVGLDRDTLRGQTIFEAFAPETIATIEPHYRSALAGETSSWELEFNDHTFHATTAPVRDDDGRIEGGMVVTHLLTAQKKLEEQLIQSQKMDAIGQLAGGVAHDFNNLLTAIRGYSELLRASVDDEEQRLWAAEVVKASEHAASLTQQLVSFSRKQVLQPRSLDLNEVITETKALLARVITERVKVETVLDPDLEHVLFDPGYLNQVLVNLAVNARDAMPDGGRLLIETANISLDEHFAREHLDVEAGDYVMVTVSDNGHGMTKETLAHVFEPFFTTKREGHGTGLGLSTVYGIIRQSGGHVSVYSEPGQGTVFRLYFPPARSEDVAAPAVAPTPRLTHDLRILVVDDDEGVRRIIEIMLAQHGHEAILARDLTEALEACEREEFDLLITDLVVPGGDGVEIAKRLAERHPHLCVLYTSGYTTETIQESLPHQATFLPKPFTMHQLIDVVHRMFEDSARIAARR
jgi:signal transduction histidine kinase/CheY-like chemotaxis protein